MKSTLALVAIAGFAAAASAQNFNLSIVGAPTSVDATAGATITVSVTGGADFGTHMLGGGFSLTGDAMISGMTWTNAAWSAFNTDGGFDGAGNYGTTIFGQLVIPGVPPFDQPAPGSEVGSAIGSFQIVIAAGSNGMLNLSLNAASPFSLQVIDIATGVTADSSGANATLALNGASINVTSVPAPSAMALLGLGGLVAGRRRR